MPNVTGVNLEGQLSDEEIRIITTLAQTLGLDPSPPSPSCGCDRCFAVSVIALAVRVMGTEEAGRFLVETERLLGEITDEKKLDDLSFERFDSLCALIDPLLANARAARSDEIS
jgi:hypothetical protein